MNMKRCFTLLLFLFSCCHATLPSLCLFGAIWTGPSAGFPQPRLILFVSILMVCKSSWSASAINPFSLLPLSQKKESVGFFFFKRQKIKGSEIHSKMKTLKTFSLGKICILIGIKPAKNEGLRDTSNHQGKGINQTSLTACLLQVCNLHALP